MSLQSRIRQIAQAAAAAYVNTQVSINSNNTTASSSVQFATIQTYTGGMYTVLLTDGTTQTVPPGGLRPLSIGSGVLISNGAIVG
jgi:hypothetical protein